MERCNRRCKRLVVEGRPGLPNLLAHFFAPGRILLASLDRVGALTGAFGFAGVLALTLTHPLRIGQTLTSFRKRFLPT